MVNDYWVASVLHDLGKYADENGLSRLSMAMRSATDGFLDDMRDEHVKGIARLDHKDSKNLDLQVVVKFPEKVRH